MFQLVVTHSVSSFNPVAQTSMTKVLTRIASLEATKVSNKFSQCLYFTLKLKRNDRFNVGNHWSRIKPVVLRFKRIAYHKISNSLDNSSTLVSVVKGNGFEITELFKKESSFYIYEHRKIVSDAEMGTFFPFFPLEQHVYFLHSNAS